MPPKTERIKDFIKKVDTKIANLKKKREAAVRELAEIELAEAKAEAPPSRKKNRNAAHEWSQSVHSDYRSTCWECENCGKEVWTKKGEFPADDTSCD